MDSPVLVGGSLTVMNVVAAREVRARREKIVDVFVDVFGCPCKGEWEGEEEGGDKKRTRR